MGLFTKKRVSKEEVIREIEQLGDSDPSMKMAFSPILSSLKSGPAANYSMAAGVFVQLADDFEKTGVADANTIKKLREIGDKVNGL